MIPAIVLSAHSMGLAVIRSLGNSGVPVIALSYEDKDMGYVSKYCRGMINIPHPEAESEAFIESLLAFGKMVNHAVLIPADDPTIVAVSKNIELLREFFLVAAPDWNITRQFIVKRHTYELAEELNIPHPKTLFPEYVEEARIFAKNIEYPCLVKPFESHKYFEKFRKKMTVVQNRYELITEVESSLLNNIPVMLQEIIPGEEINGVNYNCYRVEGKVVQEHFARKVRLSNSGYGVPVVVRSIDGIPEIAEHTHRLLDSMKFNGFSCTEFKKDERDGIYKLMEVNGRHNRSALLALKCGINFPLIEYNYLARNYLHQELNYKNNIYWIDEFRDLENFFRRIFKEKYSLKNFLSPYMHKHIFAVSSFSDLSPFIKRLKDSVSILSRRVNKNRKEIKHDIRTGYISSK